MIRSVVSKMKQNNMMAKIKDSKARSKNKKLPIYKISQQYCFGLKSKYSMDTLSTPLEISNNLIIDNFTSTQVAIMTSLLTLNRALFDITIPENFISCKEIEPVDKNMTKDQNNNNLNNNDETLVDPLASAHWNKRTSRYVLCSVRQNQYHKLSQKSMDQDTLVLNKCKVTCRISLNDDLVMLDDFMDLMRNQTKFIDPKDDYLNNIGLNLFEKQILREVARTKEIGLNFNQLKDSLKSRFVTDCKLKSTIRKLCDEQVLFEVGVDEVRLVTHKFVLPWLVHVQVPCDDAEESLMDTSSENVTINEIADKQSNNKAIDDEHTENLDESSQTENSTKSDFTKSNKSKMIHYLPKFWKNAFGQLDKRVMIIFLSGILGHVIANPGITNTDLINYFKLCLPPVQTIELVDLLVAAKCIDRKEHIVESYLTLFGAPEQFTLFYYEPTPQAFLSICAIKNLLKE